MNGHFYVEQFASWCRVEFRFFYSADELRACSADLPVGCCVDLLVHAANYTIRNNASMLLRK
jgi:hypothetical protein